MTSQAWNVNTFNKARIEHKKPLDVVGVFSGTRHSMFKCLTEIELHAIEANKGMGPKCPKDLMAL